jgi:hypothetical protein
VVASSVPLVFVTQAFLALGLREYLRGQVDAG